MFRVGARAALLAAVLGRERGRYSHAYCGNAPHFPFQNRPTFQQVVTLTRKLPR